MNIKRFMLDQDIDPGPRIPLWDKLHEGLARYFSKPFAEVLDGHIEFMYCPLGTETIKIKPKIGCSHQLKLALTVIGIMITVTKTGCLECSIPPVKKD